MCVCVCVCVCVCLCVSVSVSVSVSVHLVAELVSRMVLALFPAESPLKKLNVVASSEVAGSSYPSTSNNWLERISLV